jgi:N-acetylmuramoyl-L-alanine amidase
MISALRRWRPAVLALALALGAVPGATGAAPPRNAGGPAYVRLLDWARNHELEVRWVKRDECLQLSNRSARIQLTVDSREAQINGVSVWLLFPVVQRNGALGLAQLDAQNTLQPILSPPRGRSGSSIRTICLDPGHGGKEPGYCVGSNQEKKYTLLLAQEVAQQLARSGLKAVLTRSRDAFVELPDRPDLARRRNADLFVSLHFNSADRAPATAQGTEVYCLTPVGASSTNARGTGGSSGAHAGNRNNDRNLYFAYVMQKTLTRKLGVEDRGVRRARFKVLCDAQMPAILIETGFMSHPQEGRKIFTAAYRQQVARAIVDGVLAYKKQVERGT